MNKQQIKQIAENVASKATVGVPLGTNSAGQVAEVAKMVTMQDPVNSSLRMLAASSSLIVFVLSLFGIVTDEATVQLVVSLLGSAVSACAAVYSKIKDIRMTR
jgi:hypothetical protein